MTESNLPNPNGWGRSEKYVLEALERLTAKLDVIDEKVTNLRVEVAQKGALWGAISGAIVGIIGLVLRR